MAAKFPDSSALVSVLSTAVRYHIGYSSYWYKSIDIYFGYQNIQTTECRKWVYFVVTLCSEKFACLWCKVILLICRLFVPTTMCAPLQFMSPLMALGNWEDWSIFVCMLMVFSLSYKNLFHINMLLNVFKAVSIWGKHDYEAQYEIKRR